MVATVMVAVVVETLFSVTLTLVHVVVVLRVTIVETGTSLMELDCNSVVISLNNVITGELRYTVGTVPPHQLVSIAVIFQPMLSMMITMTTGHRQ